MIRFKTNASIRRFIALQQRNNPKAPSGLWERWKLFIEINREPVTFKEWLDKRVNRILRG